MQQKSFSEREYDSKKRLTRRDRFLSEIERITPWQALLAEIEPLYPSGEGRGRPPRGAGTMLRMTIAQHCFGLSDEGIEDAIYDSQAVRAFVGIDLSRQTAPDATTVLKFRRLLETHQLTQRIFASINNYLNMQGLILREGTVVDATIINAPSSTKNKDGARDPEMHSTKKGKDWHFGMKAHIGVDAHTGVVHMLVTTPANVADVTVGHALLHGDEKLALADAGYQGVDKRPEAPGESTVRWHVAMRPGKRRALGDEPGDRLDKTLERLKSRVRACVEHPFHIVKNLFKLGKVRYRGLAKNTAQLHMLFAIGNLLIASRWQRRINAQNGF